MDALKTCFALGPWLPMTTFTNMLAWHLPSFLLFRPVLPAFVENAKKNRPEARLAGGWDLDANAIIIN